MMPFPEQRPSWTDWLWPLALMVGIAFASSGPVAGGPKVPHLDKVVHFLVYGLLGTAFARVRLLRRRGALGLGWAVVFASAYGVIDEWHQSFTPERSVELGDWVADTAGAALAIWLYTKWSFYRTVLEMPLVRPNQRRVKSAESTLSDPIA